MVSREGAGPPPGAGGRQRRAQMHEAKKKLTITVRASATTLTEIFGVGPVVAATVIGEVRDVSRFADRDHFAAYNGTQPRIAGAGGFMA
jgi:transposase